MPKTPWPIELGEHPFGEKRHQKEKETSKERSIHNKERLEGKSRMEIAEECFEHPEEYREQILEYVSVESKEKFEGGSVFYMWLNKVCPVGCEFCFFKSPAKGEKTPDEEITEEGIERIIQLTKDGKIDKLVISGGGEPMKSKSKVNDLARGVDVKDLIVVTSAYWSKTRSGTDRVLSALLASAEENPHQPVTTVRVSLDQGHFSRLSKDEGFQYVQNIVDWFSENAKDNPNFKLVFHTMDGDNTVEDFIAQLQVQSRDERKNNKAKVLLEDNLSFGIEYTQIFFASPFVNLKDQKEQARNTQTFKKFIFDKRGGNMSLSFHGESNPKGVYYLTFYDGTTIIWGATAPDTETSIYKDDYSSIMKKNLKDVATLGILEKGQFHVQDLVSEVNPKAVERAIGVGLRDFYVRLLLEEDTTRLYTSIRLIQGYVAEGRITEEDQKAWPEELKITVSMSREELKEACLSSRHNIVQQYLDDPAVSADKLVALHTRIALGHYSVTPEEMYKAVAQSRIDSSIKRNFMERVSPPQSELSSL